jgi:LmbE family N-acetylglucosaminyl deacetylase
MSETLVAVPAHADDAELNAGGAMAKWAAAGGSIHIVMVTNNCSGSMIPPDGSEEAKRRLPPLETTAIRRREQEAAAALLGAKVHYLDYCQRHFWDGEKEISEGYGDIPAPPGIAGHPPILIACQQREHIERLAKLLVELRPGLVLTQSVLDLDPEHHAVAAMVWHAFRRREAELGNVPLRFWTPGSSCQDGLFDPGYGHIEDISEFHERKLELCRCHASQMTQVRLDMVERRAKLWGAGIGVRYAEPFKTASR